MEKQIILNKRHIDLTLKRLCYQLIESHNDFSNSVIIGLQPRGIHVVTRLKKQLEEILGKEVVCGNLDITFYRDDFRRREKPLIPSATNIDFVIEGKNIIIATGSKPASLPFIKIDKDRVITSTEALKLKEISYIHAEGYPAAEMKHGPIALVDEKLPVVFVATKDPYYEKIVSNIQEIKARKGQVIAVVSENDEVIPTMSNDIMFVPEADEIVAPILSVIPLQLLSYYIGVAKGLDVDKPRNLAKSVTVE